MKRWIRVGSAVAAFLAIAGTTAVAQSDIKKDERLKQPIVLDFKDTPISTALQVLFTGTGMNYVIESNVSGVVKNMHIEVPFEQALKALLKSVDPPLVYKKEPGGDVYIISVKKTEPIITEMPVIDTNPIIEDVAASQDTIIEKISLNFLDAYIVKALIEGTADTRDSQSSSGLGDLGTSTGNSNRSSGSSSSSNSWGNRSSGSGNSFGSGSRGF